MLHVPQKCQCIGSREIVTASHFEYAKPMSVLLGYVSAATLTTFAFTGKIVQVDSRCSNQENEVLSVPTPDCIQPVKWRATDIDRRDTDKTASNPYTYRRYSFLCHKNLPIWPADPAIVSTARNVQDGAMP